MDLKSQLIRDEGDSPFAYTDSEGFLTIGVGFLIDRRRGGGLQPEEIDFILENRISLAQKGLEAALPWFSSIGEPRQAALTNMAFQLGVEGILSFKSMLAACAEGRWFDARALALDSLWAKQTPLRADRVVNQLALGEWV